MNYIGKQIEVGLGVEETRGTPQGTAEKWLKKVTATVLSKSEKVVDNASRGVLEDSDGRRVVKKWYEGDIEGIVYADAIGYLFLNVFGAVTSQVVSGSVYSHIFEVAQNIQHPALTLFMKDGVSQNVLANSMINSLELTAVQNDYVRFKAGFLAKSGTTNADTVSYDTEYDFIGKDIVVKIADSEAGLAGATATKVKSLNINFDQGLISDFVLGSYNPDDIYNAKLGIEGSITKNHENNTFEALNNNDSAKYMSITITGDTEIATGVYPTITIILNKVLVTDWSRNDGNDELITETINFKAFYNATDAEACKVTLQNLTTEYDQPISA